LLPDPEEGIIPGVLELPEGFFPEEPAFPEGVDVAGAVPENPGLLVLLPPEDVDPPPEVTGPFSVGEEEEGTPCWLPRSGEDDPWPYGDPPFG